MRKRPVHAEKDEQGEREEGERQRGRWQQQWRRELVEEQHASTGKQGRKLESEKATLIEILNFNQLNLNTVTTPKD